MLEKPKLKVKIEDCSFESEGEKEAIDSSYKIFIKAVKKRFRKPKSNESKGGE